MHVPGNRCMSKGNTDLYMGKLSTGFLLIKTKNTFPFGMFVIYMVNAIMSKLKNIEKLLTSYQQYSYHIGNVVSDHMIVLKYNTRFLFSLS